jgi:transposase
MQAAGGKAMSHGNTVGGGGKPRRQYDENYKRHAVELTLRGDRAVTQVAGELGVAESMLYEWRRKYAPRPGAATGAPPSLEQATEEIARLRREVVRLQEREIILKKSLGILSETPESGMPKSKR